MVPPSSISLEEITDTSLDFDHLKSIGVEYIESIASELWTDYNAHDPGITTLDMLCYALTDLAGRTRLPAQDLIAESDQHSFHLAKKILPNKALTLKDYRKLLMDSPAVRDGKCTLASKSEIDVYYNEEEGVLSYSSGDSLISQRGLFETELDLDDPYSEDWVALSLDLGDLGVMNVHVYFNPFEGVDQGWFDPSGVAWVKIADINHPVGVEDDDDVNSYDRYYAEVNIRFNGGEVLTGIALWIRLHNPILKTNELVDTAIRSEIQRFLTDLTVPANAVVNYHKRLNLAIGIKEEAIESLHANRNLAEDWLHTRVRSVQQVGVCIEHLELAPHLDPEEVVGHIYMAIDQFFAPSLQPQSLDELLGEGVLPERIFEGPLLQQGFILDDRIGQHERNGNLYTSDLVALIMNLNIRGQKAVIAVSGLELVSYINRHEVATGVKNCLRPKDPSNYRLKFSHFYSKIHVAQGGILLDRVDAQAVGVKTYGGLKSSLEEFEPPGVTNIPIPQGKKQDVERYFSIQEDFPSGYKLRTGALTQKDGDLRRAQVKQYKAYLLFFEQILADYCSQLAHIQDIFSSDPVTAKTYFFQPLHMVPGVETVIANLGEYESQLETIVETPEGFLERRNEMADHLLARLAEDFSSYAAIAYQNAASYQLLEDKLVFYNEYHQLSSTRACAFNYCWKKSGTFPIIWNTDNVSGFEKRLARLLGMPNYYRRNLATPTNLRDYVEEFDGVDTNADGVLEVYFRIRKLPLSVDPGSPILLSGTNRYPQGDVLEEEIQMALTFAASRSQYEVLMREDGTYYFTLVDASRMIIAQHDESFNTLVEAEAAIAQIISLVEGRADEGFHVIEHILLRPRDETYPLMNTNRETVPSTSDPNMFYTTHFIKEPYSAQVSIIIPGFAGRFRDSGFRKITEQLIHLELPAHICPYIIWVEEDRMEDMSNFESAFRSWLNSLCDGSDLRERTSVLMSRLQTLSL